MDRSEWLAARRKGIGSSDAAAVCGLSPWSDPLKVYLDKVGLLEDEDSPQMARGRKWEPIVAQLYEQETGLALQEPAEGLYRDEKRPWMLATPDRISSEGVIVELKTADSRDGWGEPGTDEVPGHYLVQVQHQMEVLPWTARHAEVAVVFPHFEFAVFRVFYSPKLVAGLIEREAAFWGLVERREAPAPDWSRDYTPALLAQLYQPVEGKAVTLDARARELADLYESLGAQARHYQRAREQAKGRLIEALGDAELGLLPDGRRIRRKQITVKEYTIPAKTYVDFRLLGGGRKERSE